MSNPMLIGETTTDTVTPRFVELLSVVNAPRVVEFGTLRWGAEPTHHRHWVPHAATFTMSDITAGTDVDVVADLHNLDGAFGSVDAVIAVSVWEHLARPWVAAREVADILAHGGLLFVATHQSFPIHGYPSDYFRFTTQALEVLFEDAGLVTVTTGYAYPAKIIPPREVTRWDPTAPVFLNVAGVWAKP